MDVKVKYNYNF